MNRFLTTTDTGADTRRIPGWDLTSRARPVGLVYWTQRTNQLCDWSVGDFSKSAMDDEIRNATASGASAWLFDVETSNPSLVALHAVVDYVRRTSATPVLFYGSVPYFADDRGLYDKCGAVKIPAGQIMRPDDLAWHLNLIRSQSQAIAKAHPKLPRFYIMQDTYNWGELPKYAGTAPKDDPHPEAYLGLDEVAAAKWWPDLPPRDCRAILDVNDYLHNNVVVFQPAPMPNEWQSGIRPLYVELLRGEAERDERKRGTGR